MSSIADSVSFNAHGVIPVVTQDYDTGEVLSFAYMNRETLLKTEETGRLVLVRDHRETSPDDSHEFEMDSLPFVKQVFLSEDSRSLLFRVTRRVPPGEPRPRSAFHRRWCPRTQSWVEEGERGFVPPADVSN